MASLELLTPLLHGMAQFGNFIDAEGLGHPLYGVNLAMYLSPQLLIQDIFFRLNQNSV